jgi:coiled-coil domain-containing protein 55
LKIDPRYYKITRSEENNVKAVVFITTTFYLYYSSVCCNRNSVARLSHRTQDTLNTATMNFGLNNRKKKKNANEKKITTSKNVFDDGDDDDSNSDDNGESGTGREEVNKQIVREQAARRRRAQADLASVKDKSMYDYDGAYDSFQTKTDNTSKEEKKEQKCKYIGDLMKMAKVRERERDGIYERKIAREQAEEDNKDEYLGKEKFVTNSYKRKLQERKQWEAEQVEKEREEEANDVTKKSAGAAFAGFYGNLNRNAKIKKSDDVDQNENEKDEDDNDNRMSEQDENEIDNDIPHNKKKEKTVIFDDDDDFDPTQGFLGGFERSSTANEEKTTESINAQHPDDKESENQPPSSLNDDDFPLTKQSLRELREKKVAEAKVRYLKRKQLTLLEQ